MYYAPVYIWWPTCFCPSHWIKQSFTYFISLCMLHVPLNQSSWNYSTFLLLFLYFVQMFISLTFPNTSICILCLMWDTHVEGVTFYSAIKPIQDTHPVTEISALRMTLVNRTEGNWGSSSSDVELAKTTNSSCDSVSARPLGSNRSWILAGVPCLKGLPILHFISVLLCGVQLMCLLWKQETMLEHKTTV